MTGTSSATHDREQHAHAAEQAATLGDAVQLLRNSGARLTEQRRAILEVLAASEEHLSAREVFDAVGADGPTDLASTHRNLTQLRKLGVTHTVFTERGQLHGLTHSSHHHWQCLGCSQVEDVDPTLVAGALPIVQGATGNRTAGGGLVAIGYCDACRRTMGS